jgi:hypothetical protein
MKASAYMAMAQLHESLDEPSEAAEQYKLAAKAYSNL